MDSIPDDEVRSGFRLWTGVVFAAAFLAALVAPALVAFGVDGHAEQVRAAAFEERRQPAPFPERPEDFGATLQKWPGRFEAWWNDAFGLRTTLIRWHNIVRLFGFGVRPGPAVILGEGADGEPWMYVSIQAAVDDFRGLLPFDDDELLHWKSVLEQRRDWLARSNCRYLFVIAPNKSSIYPELMPAEYTRVGQQTRADQLVAYLREHSSVEIVDLRQVLVDARGKSYEPVRPGANLYFPLGTHWTSYGAWVGHLEIMRALKPWFPRTWPTPLSRYRVTEVEGEGDTWATRFHMGDLLRQRFPVLNYVGPPAVHRTPGEQGLIVYESEHDGPVCVLLRDSFSTQLAPHLSPHFRRLVVAWNQVLPPEFTVDVVRKAKPDLVIEQVVERFLAGSVPPMLPSTPKFR